MQNWQLIYEVAKCLRRRAVSTHSDAIGFSPLNVVRLLSSVSVIWSNNLAMHSSANELLQQPDLRDRSADELRDTVSFDSVFGECLYIVTCWRPIENYIYIKNMETNVFSLKQTSFDQWWVSLLTVLRDLPEEISEQPFLPKYNPKYHSETLKWDFEYLICASRDYWADCVFQEEDS